MTCEEDTAYARALSAGKRAGYAAADPAAMAVFCEHVLPLIVNADYSPRKVWEGAQKAGLTTFELNELCVSKNYDAINALLDG